MCLNTITERFDPPKQEEVVAWKIFSECDGLYFFFTATHRDYSRVKSNVWLKAKPGEYRVRAYDENSYVAGFHAFVNKEDALNLKDRLDKSAYLSGSVLKQVILRNVTYAGTDGTDGASNYKVLVAQEMFVPEEQ